MQIRTIIPDNVEDIKLHELQRYNLLLCKEFEEYSQEMYSTQRRIRRLSHTRAGMKNTIIVEVANQQLAVTKAADRYSPKERTALVEVRLASEFERENELLELQVMEEELGQIRSNLDFQADRIKQAILAATAHKKYGGSVTN